MNTTISSFHNITFIANGKYGEIYCAADIDKHVVAIKKIDLTNLPPDNKVLIDREVSINKRFQSKYIVHLKNSFIQEGFLFIIMEYCNSGDLYREITMTSLKRMRYSIDLIKKRIIQILHGLAHIHSFNIIHRDIKPDNIMLNKLDNEIVCKIGDFGLSFDLSNEPSPTSFTGTPLYMAPEVVFNIPYDTKVDIWSLGIVIHELYYLKSPFEHPDFFVILDKVRECEVPVINCPDKSFSEMVSRMTNRDPSLRPTTIEILKSNVFGSYDRQLCQVSSPPKLLDKVSQYYKPKIPIPKSNIILQKSLTDKVNGEMKISSKLLAGNSESDSFESTLNNNINLFSKPPRSPQSNVSERIGPNDQDYPYQNTYNSKSSLPTKTSRQTAMSPSGTPDKINASTWESRVKSHPIVDNNNRQIISPSKTMGANLSKYSYNPSNINLNTNPNNVNQQSNVKANYNLHTNKVIKINLQPHKPRLYNGTVSPTQHFHHEYPENTSSSNIPVQISTNLSPPSLSVQDKKASIILNQQSYSYSKSIVDMVETNSTHSESSIQSYDDNYTNQQEFDFNLKYNRDGTTYINVTNTNDINNNLLNISPTQNVFYPNNSENITGYTQYDDSSQNQKLNSQNHNKNTYDVSNMRRGHPNIGNNKNNSSSFNLSRQSLLLPSSKEENNRNKVGIVSKLKFNSTNHNKRIANSGIYIRPDKSSLASNISRDKSFYDGQSLSPKYRRPNKSKSKFKSRDLENINRSPSLNCSHVEQYQNQYINFNEVPNQAKSLNSKKLSSLSNKSFNTKKLLTKKAKLTPSSSLTSQILPPPTISPHRNNGDKATVMNKIDNLGTSNKVKGPAIKPTIHVSTQNKLSSSLSTKNSYKISNYLSNSNDSKSREAYQTNKELVKFKNDDTEIVKSKFVKKPTNKTSSEVHAHINRANIIVVNNPNNNNIIPIDDDQSTSFIFDPIGSNLVTPANKKHRF